MLTSRSWWFLLIDLTMLALGVLGALPALALVALTLLLWFLGEWLRFALRSRLVVGGVRVYRDLGGGHESATLWAGRTFPVRVEIHLQGRFSLPCVSVIDWVPLGVQHVTGATQCDGALKPDQPLQLQYELRCRGVGRVRFEGVQLQFADLQGFFLYSTFIPNVVLCRVLPPPVDASGHAATSKRHNLLPPPGIHRMHRPGSGSELLDLRDYLPGDPPKTIAWKVSARRDRLITKEFESEVPVRCTLFVDTSHSVRLGPPGQNALADLLETAAGVAQANSANRDLTGLVLFDEETVQIMRPARGSRHLAQLIHRLVDTASLSPATGKAEVNDLMQLAYPLAQEVYPYLMRPEVNHVPFWLPWLWPVPAHSRRPTSGLRHVYRLLFILFAVIALVFSTLLSYVFTDLGQEKAPPGWMPSPLLMDLLVLFGLIAALPFLKRVYHFIPLALSFRKRRLARWRKRLAALLAVRHELGPAAIAHLLEDDEQFALELQRFLAEHQVPYTLPLYDARGRYLFACPRKIDLLSRALLQAVGKGQDNELFVLMVDLLELPDRLDPLLRAVRVALARHHQVVVVCSWPPGVPPPGRESAKEDDRPGSKSRSLSALLKKATSLRLQTAFGHLRHTFARLSVPVVWAVGEEPIPLILERMDRLRGLGRRR